MVAVVSVINAYRVSILFQVLHFQCLPPPSLPARSLDPSTGRGRPSGFSLGTGKERGRNVERRSAVSHHAVYFFGFFLTASGLVPNVATVLTWTYE